MTLLREAEELIIEAKAGWHNMPKNECTHLWWSQANRWLARMNWDVHEAPTTSPWPWEKLGCETLRRVEAITAKYMPEDGADRQLVECYLQMLYARFLAADRMGWELPEKTSQPTTLLGNSSVPVCDEEVKEAV